MQGVEYAYVEFPARGVWGDTSSGTFWNIAIKRLNLEAIFNQILYCTERLWEYKMDEFSCKKFYKNMYRSTLLNAIGL